MIFKRKILQEKIPNLSKEEVKGYEQWDTDIDTKIDKYIELFKEGNINNLENLKEVIKKALRYGSYNPKDNDFIKFLGKLTWKPTLQQAELFDALYELPKTFGYMDLDHDYLLNPSLYNRSKEDFLHAVKIFETILDPSKARKFFKNTEKLNIKEFFDGNKIKPTFDPAGKEKTIAGDKSIQGVVLKWEQDTENINSQEYDDQDTLSFNIKKIKNKDAFFKDLYPILQKYNLADVK